jgi:hypothetical protein
MMKALSTSSAVNSNCCRMPEDEEVLAAPVLGRFNRDWNFT